MTEYETRVVEDIANHFDSAPAVINNLYPLVYVSIVNDYWNDYIASCEMKTPETGLEII
jgi:hypothetical protein